MEYLDTQNPLWGKELYAGPGVSENLFVQNKASKKCH